MAADVRLLRGTTPIKCGRGLAPDCSVSGQVQVTDTPLSGASPLPHLDWCASVAALAVAQLMEAGRLLSDERLQNPYVSGLRALRSVRNFVFYFLVLFQGFVPIRLDRRVMGENICASIIRSNKPKPLRRVKPLHSTRCHCRSPDLRDKAHCGCIDRIAPMDSLDLHPQAHGKLNASRNHEVHSHIVFTVFQGNQTHPGFLVVIFDSASDRLQNHSPCLSSTAFAQCFRQ
ncbi:hypothetical protein PS720_04572 [Pseudomonas fluorescens]|nr:hypothetical protein PS720_04572 [Pseudomonas fluorescens]